MKRAVLYVTGKDTAAAWVNGKQVLTAMPMPPWKQFPWQTYTTTVVTPELRSGNNLLAVEVLSYSASPSGAVVAGDGQTPMSACLYLEMADGSVTVLKSGTRTSGEGWKATLSGADGWQRPGFSDAGWPAAVAYAGARGRAIRGRRGR